MRRSLQIVLYANILIASVKSSTGQILLSYSRVRAMVGQETYDEIIRI